MSYRIAAIVDRTGIPGMTLRSWERRYGFPRPKRTRSGYRTYSEDDLRQVLAVKAMLDNGAPVSEAIEAVRKGKAAIPDEPAVLLDSFFKAAQEVDEITLEEVALKAETSMRPQKFCEEFVLPALRRAADELDIGREHLATSVLRMHLRRTLQRIDTPRHGAPILLACPEKEEHEGGLLLTAVQLRLLGARAVLLGANTPPEAIGAAAKRANARAIGISLIGTRREQDVKRVTTAVVKHAHGIPVFAGGACARKHLQAVFAAGARYAADANELLELLG